MSVLYLKNKRIVKFTTKTRLLIIGLHPLKQNERIFHLFFTKQQETDKNVCSILVFYWIELIWTYQVSGIIESCLLLSWLFFPTSQFFLMILVLRFCATPVYFDLSKLIDWMSVFVAVFIFLEYYRYRYHVFRFWFFRVYSESYQFCHYPCFHHDQILICRNFDGFTWRLMLWCYGFVKCFYNCISFSCLVLDSARWYSFEI